MQWSNALLQVFTRLGTLTYSTDRIIDVQSGWAWHEIGRGASVTFPIPVNDYIDVLYETGSRAYVTINNNDAATIHVIADFIVESTNREEMTTESGGVVPLIRLAGRDLIKQLAQAPVNVRHISKRRQGGQAEAITENTLQMNGADAAAFAATSLIGWTVELVTGDWSEIIDHTAEGLLTIDPPWQSFVDYETIPTVQPFVVYGAAFTETTGAYTDIKQALLNAPGWQIHPQSYQSTVNGSFLGPGEEASSLKALQLIAAQTEEYFDRVPLEKAIQWRREVPPVTHPSYGFPLRIVTGPTFDPFKEALLLPGGRLTIDATEQVTRVKPMGGGSGDKALTLRDWPDEVLIPSPGYGYIGEWLTHNESEVDGTIIAKTLNFPGIAPASDSAVSRGLAARALYNAAFSWLKEHITPRVVYECEVMSAVPIRPVTYLYVMRPDAGLEMMYVLESTVTYKERQVIYKLQLSNKKSPMMTEERLLAEAIWKVDGGIFYTNAPSRNSRTLDAAASLAGGGGGESDHEPVTAGNAAIGVATGQVVSLVLAGPSGLEVASTGLRLADSVAGNGLAVSNKVLSLNLAAHSGMAVTSDQLALGLPGGLSAASVNAVTGTTHSHAVSAFSNAKTSPGQLLKGDPTGNLTLATLTADRLIAPILESTGAITLDPATSLIYADGNLSFVGARQIVTDSGSLTLAPAQTLIIDPANGVAQLGTDTTVKTAHAAVGTFPQTGWQVNYPGDGYFKSLLADELHVQSFIADIMRVKVGGEYIPESMALIARAFPIPAVGAMGLLYVEDVPGWAGIPAFADGDWVLLRIVNRDGGGLIIANAWGQVTGYVDQPAGEQRWTFTTRIATTAVGKSAQRGDLALDFGKSGSWWWYVTVLDGAGPHAGFGRWQGNNPTENVTYPIRLGQLQGVTGVNELGLQAGLSTGARMKFSDYGGEIHGTRLSLYAGDNAQLRVAAATVVFYTTISATQNLVPNADHSSLRVVSSLGTFYQAIDEGTASPNYTDYIANAANSNGYVTVGLGNPTFSAIYQIILSYALNGVGFSNDTVKLYAQVFKSDEVSPLTGEVLVRTHTTNTSIQASITLPHDDAATQTDWAGARLRLRWEYQINANEEAIRLDPSIPSLAVGNPLPTSYAGGGDGLWAGLDSGLYKLRLGKAAGVGLHWTGAAVELRNSANAPTITLDSSGNSRFDGAMTIGTAGGIWQGTGTFAAPTTGLKLYNSGGIGRLSTFNAGLEQLTINTAGQLAVGQGKVILDRRGISIAAEGTNTEETAINWRTPAGGTFGSLEAVYHGTANTVELSTAPGSNGSQIAQLLLVGNNGSNTRGTLVAGTTAISAYHNGAVLVDATALQVDADVRISDGLAVGDINLTPPAPGVILATSHIRTDGGLVLGNSAASLGAAGVLTMLERTTDPIHAAGWAHLYVRDVSGVQKLYIRFDNGVIRELATA